MALNVENAAKAFAKVREDYLHDSRSAARKTELIEAMYYFTRFVRDGKVALMSPPEGSVAMLRDFACLYGLAKEVSRFRTVKAVNCVLKEDRALIGEGLVGAFEELLGCRLYEDGEYVPIDPVSFRASLMRMPEE